MRTRKKTKHSKRHLRRWVKIAINFIICVITYFACFYIATGVLKLMDSHKNNDNANLAFMEFQDSEEYFQEHIEDFKKWKRKEWMNEDDLEEKLRLCQIACNYELIYAGIHKNIDVKARNLREHVLGQYRDSRKTIEIDKEFLMCATPTEVYNVVAHEVTHCKQAEEVRAYKSTDLRYQDLILFDEIKIYEFEIKNYIDGEEDISEYAKQTVEITARLNALEREEETFAKIDSIPD